MDEETGVQQEWFALLPGVAGGRALVRRYGRDHMRQIGRRGGIATRDRYGLAYLRELGERGRAARREHARRQIRLITYPDGEQQRLVPYLPPGRRKRPIIVRFYLSDELQTEEQP